MVIDFIESVDSELLRRTGHGLTLILIYDIECRNRYLRSKWPSFELLNNELPLSHGKIFRILL